jgi:hypothetical protein
MGTTETPEEPFTGFTVWAGALWIPNRTGSLRIGYYLSYAINSWYFMDLKIRCP